MFHNEILHYKINLEKMSVRSWIVSSLNTQKHGLSYVISNFFFERNKLNTLPWMSSAYWNSCSGTLSEVSYLSKAFVVLIWIAFISCFIIIISFLRN